VQKKIEKAIINNDHLSLIEILKNKNANPNYQCNLHIRQASKFGSIDCVEVLLKDSRVDPSEYDNWSIRHAIESGHLHIVKLLIKDKRVDPSFNNNESFKYIYSFFDDPIYEKIIIELIKDKRVANKLRKTDLKIFNEVYKKIINDKIIIF
jgi:hypothetical protein